MEPAQPGHVRRARLLEPGSVAARLYARAVSEAPQEPESQAPDEDVEPAQITWPELWDARLLAGNVAQSIAAATTSGQQISDAWPHSTQQQKAAKKVVQYSRTLAGVQTNKRQRSVDDGDGDGGTTVDIKDGAVRSEDLPLDAPTARFKPWRCRCARKLSWDAADTRPKVCNYLNRFCEDRCAACDAARWDGADGQLQARVAAALQTSDLNATSMKQLQQRLLDEQASLSGAGLACSMEDVARLVKQHLSKHSAYGSSAPAVAATSRADNGASDGRDSPGSEMVDDELLQSMDCPTEAMEVFNVLLAMLQQQQQQEHQQQEEEEAVEPAQLAEQQRAQMALRCQQQQHLAAHLAATGIALLKALVQPHIEQTRRKHNKHKHFVGTRGQWKLHEATQGRIDMVKWLGQQLDRGLLGQQEDGPQHHSHVQHADPGTAEQPAERPQALRRALPGTTIAAVLDPATMASHAALEAFATQGRRLPRVSRVYSSQQGEELGQDVMLPSQWLFRNTIRHSRTGTTCKGRRGARFAGSSDIPVVVQRQAEWGAVEAARSMVQALLLQHNPVDEATVLTAWASCPPWRLRRKLQGMTLPTWASTIAAAAHQEPAADNGASAVDVDGDETPGQRQLGSSVWRPYAAVGARGPGHVASRPSAAAAVPANNLGDVSSRLLPQDVQVVLHNALACGVQQTVLDRAAARLTRLLCNKP